MSTHHCTIAFNKARLQVTFTYFPGDPGRTSGPPERCYPPEPAEFEVVEAHLEVKDATGAWAKTNVDLQALDLIDELGITEFIETKCLEYLDDLTAVAEELEAEARAEDRKMHHA